MTAGLSGWPRTYPALAVARAGEPLAVRGDQAVIDHYVARVVEAGVAIRSLTLGEAPLEALGFMLTESAAEHADQLSAALEAVR